MTKHELSQLHYLNREIEQLTYRIDKLSSQVQRCTTVLSHTPKGKNRVDMVPELMDLKDILEKKRKECILEQRRLQSFINNLNDSQLRQIFVLRYINDLSWQKVAFSIGEHDEQYPRRKHDSYLKSCNSKKCVS